MRARSWLGVVASLSLLAACALTTDLDNLSSGGVHSGDGGAPEDGAPADGGVPSGDGGPKPGEEAGRDGGVTYGQIVLADRPIAYFPFDDPSRASLVTEKISGRNAIAKPADFTLGVPGIAGTALGASGDGELDFGDTLDVVGKNPWSIEAWIKPAFSDGKVFYEYLNKRHNGNNGLVAYVRKEDVVTVQVEQSFGGGGRGVDSILKSLDHFIHIVFVYDPEKTGLRVWVDGKVGNKGYDDNGGPTDNPQPVYIASGIQGAIDEMAVYDYALPDDRILAHFAAGKQP